jgi:hypothetical protein
MLHDAVPMVMGTRRFKPGDWPESFGRDFRGRIDIDAAQLEPNKRGIDVRVVLDKSNATARYTAATFLANQRVQVGVDYRYASMHDKFSSWTVSFNFASAGEFKNPEVNSPARSRRGEAVRAGIGQALQGVRGDEAEVLMRRAASR